jgi:hypothetical protein
MSRGLEIRVLDGVNTWSVAGSGCEVFYRGMVFFFGGSGEGKRNSRVRTADAFSQDDTSSKQSFLKHF